MGEANLSSLGLVKRQARSVWPAASMLVARYLPDSCGLRHKLLFTSDLSADIRLRMAQRGNHRNLESASPNEVCP